MDAIIGGVVVIFVFLILQILLNKYEASTTRVKKDQNIQITEKKDRSILLESIGLVIIPSLLLIFYYNNINVIQDYELSFTYFLGTATIFFAIPIARHVYILKMSKKLLPEVDIFLGVNTFLSICLIIISLLLFNLRNLKYGYNTRHADAIVPSLLIILVFWLLYAVFKVFNGIIFKYKNASNEITIQDIKKARELLELEVINKNEYDDLVLKFKNQESNKKS